MRNLSPFLLALPVALAGCEPPIHPALDAAPMSGDPDGRADDRDPDLAAAQDLVATLTLGVNVERGWAWSHPGGDDYWRYLRDDLHLTHVRLFYPWRPTVEMGGGGPGNSPPDRAGFARILDAAEAALAAGLTVFLDCTDVMGIEDFTGDAGAATDLHMQNCATWTAERALDPARFALGPVNEWAGGDDNALYDDQRARYHATLRAALPDHVLTTGAAYWKSRDFLYDPTRAFTPFDDLRVVYDWHHYSSLDEQGWIDEAARLAAWRAAHGDRPTLCGECGPGYWAEPVDDSTLEHAPHVWPDRFAAQLPHLAHEHPTLWAITYGNSYRLNRSPDDATIMNGSDGEPDLAASIRDNEAAIRAALGL